MILDNKNTNLKVQPGGVAFSFHGQLPDLWKN